VISALQQKYTWSPELIAAKRKQARASAEDSIQGMFTFHGMTPEMYRATLNAAQGEWEPEIIIVSDNSRLVALVASVNNERKAVQDDGGVHVSHFASGKETTVDDA
jgi:hypothetical protein